MFIVVRQNHPDPLYKQITDQIKNAIASGVLEENSKLPSVREMSNELKISSITVKRAYTDLEAEGFIFTRAGIGSFVSSIDMDGLKKEKLIGLKSELQTIVNSSKKFGITIPDLIKLLEEMG